MAVLPQTLDSEINRRLKDRASRVNTRLDLHGMTQAAAHAALVAFIEKAVAANRKLVLIITGKGSQGQGALRRTVPLWLEAPALYPYINAIQPAFDHHGGEGALYVQLRRIRR